MILQRELTDSAWKKTIIRPSKTKIGGIDLLTRRILQKTLSQRIFAVKHIQSSREENGPSPHEKQFHHPMKPILAHSPFLFF